MKVVVIGPIYPFRGGIAHTNQWLCEKLSLNNDVIAISFKKLFPSFLYPGKSQIEPIVEEKSWNFKVNYLLDSINPFNWLNVFRFLKKTKPHVLVFHWWHPFFAFAFIFLALFSKKSFKPKTIAVIHNVLPHEHSFIDALLSKAFFSSIDRFIVLSSSQEKELKTIKPNAEVFHVIMPSFEALAKNKGLSVDEAKKLLNIQGNILLFFGFVRKYKGLDFLLDAMPEVLKEVNVTLLIAGEFWDNKKEYENKIKSLGIEKNVIIHDFYIPVNETTKYFRAADAIVLPYISATHSGIIEMAYSYNTPIITTEVAADIKLIKNNINALIVKPADSKALAKAIIYFYKNNYSQLFKQEMIKRMHLFEWSKEKEERFFGLSD